ncbi:MAG: (d)CMP kinase [Eubacterium sp.]|nr:(d)CMP kinase [Clostridiales bacterium]MDY3774729.1 (d)CMP kinase [Eubacterium sp.]
MNIAIDGPAGAGKSSIAKLVAQKLSFVYFDTGAMYRTIALYALEHQINPAREEDVVAVLDKIQITLSHEDGEQEIFLNGTNVSKDIRREEVGKNASTVAKYAAVRQKLVSLQQEIAADMDVIMDGRDIGTVVLPNAEVKIYLTASANVRAKRRYKELQEKGESCDLTQIEKDIIARDEQDMNREISPLRQAEDAVLVDSSDMTIEEVVNCLIDIIKKKM